VTALIWGAIGLLVCGWGAAAIAVVYAGKRFDERREKKSAEVLWR
jgi:hypothetical protein